MMSRSLALRIVLKLFLVGVAGGAFLHWYGLLFFVLGSFVIWVVFWKVRSGFLKLVVCFGCALIFGTARFLLTLPNFDVKDVAFYRDLPFAVTVEGVVANEVDIRSDAIYLLFNAEKIYLDGRENMVKGHVLLKLPRYPEYSYGDRIKVRAKLQTPASFDSFDYSKFLSKDNIYAVAYNAKVELIQGDQGAQEMALLFDFKKMVTAKINQLFGEPEASLVAGILIGIRRSIPAEIIDDFNRTGLSHILAISGYNITLLITVVAMFLKKIARSVNFYLTVVVIFMFALLTGFSASVVRAALMGGLASFVLFCGRKSNGMNILLMGAALMILYNPLTLVYDISFQLSFAATLGLIIFVPIWEKYFQKLPQLLAEGLMVTLAAQVFTLPIIISGFGRFALISPLSNVLFLPLIPFVMFFAFAAIISGFLFLPVTIIFVALTWLLLEILVKGVALFAELPFASIQLPKIHLLFFGIYYLMIVAWLIFRKRKLKPNV